MRATDQPTARARGKGRPAKCIQGRVFGQLLVIGPPEHVPDAKRLHVLCRCECGTRKMIAKQHLERGDIKSCGCLRRSVRARAYARQIPTTESCGDLEELCSWLAGRTAHVWEFCRAGFGWIFDMPFRSGRARTLRYEPRVGWSLTPSAARAVT